MNRTRFNSEQSVDRIMLEVKECFSNIRFFIDVTTTVLLSVLAYGLNYHQFPIAMRSLIVYCDYEEYKLKRAVYGFKFSTSIPLWFYLVICFFILLSTEINKCFMADFRPAAKKFMKQTAHIMWMFWHGFVLVSIVIDVMKNLIGQPSPTIFSYPDIYNQYCVEKIYNLVCSKEEYILRRSFPNHFAGLTAYSAVYLTAQIHMAKIFNGFNTFKSVLSLLILVLTVGFSLQEAINQMYTVTDIVGGLCLGAAIGLYMVTSQMENFLSFWWYMPPTIIPAEEPDEFFSMDGNSTSAVKYCFTNFDPVLNIVEEIEEVNDPMNVIEIVTIESQHL